MMRFSPALAVYRLGAWLAAPLAASLLRRRMARGKEDPGRIGERLGKPGAARPPGRLIWLHGASVGEAMSALPLIDALLAAADASILLTTGTVTSARRLEGALPMGAVHQYVPVDTALAVNRFLDHWRPDLGVWIESELWPGLVRATARRGVPMAMVNARISARSHASWRRAPGMARRLLASFGLILAQDTETVDRLHDLGAAARFAGNLKALVAPPGCDAAELGRLRTTISGRPVWLAASTHPGEEEEVLAAQRALGEADAPPLLILALRHPERGGEVAALADGAGLRVARRSRGEAPDAGTSVWLADTLGEMGLWYRLAPVSFIGGSLSRNGGHTPFEPILLGSTVLHGPHVANFAPAYAALAEADGAIEVADAPALAATVSNLFADADARKCLAKRASVAHDALRPDAAAIAAELVALMEAP